MFHFKEKTINKIKKYLTIFTTIQLLFSIGGRIAGVYTNSKMLFNIMLCTCMLLILIVPEHLFKHLSIKIPLELYFLVFLFAFCAIILGDVLNYYNYYPWWDSMLHFLSGVIIPFFGLWLIKLLMAEKSELIYMNKTFTMIFILMLTMGLGAMWEIVEYTYDDLFNTNTQQFMETTTGSLISEEDIPLTGHDALNDTMKDLKLALGGSITVIAYASFKDRKKQKEN